VKEPVVPEGNPEAVKLTVCAAPLLKAIPMPTEAESPSGTVIELFPMLMPKSNDGGGTSPTVKVMTAVLMRLLLLATTVIV
jgi:hypothetical protein